MSPIFLNLSRTISTVEPAEFSLFSKTLNASVRLVGLCFLSLHPKRPEQLGALSTFVVLVIAAISLFSHKLGMEKALAVSLFPMVILTMTIERLSITWEERGGAQSLKAAIGTLIAATLAHLLMTIPELTYFVFTFPAVLLILVAFMLAMGRYRGYRLTELMRFKALTKS